jgi:hypothetical protein
MFNNLLILVSLSFIFSCQSNKNATNQTSKTDISIKQEQPQSLPPESCRIRGKIISIKAVDSEVKGNTPCDKNPCDAEVLIEKVLGYGSSFSAMLYPEDVITLHFSFTLSNTKQVFPDKNVIELPGLNTGDLFEANIEGNLLNKKNFTVNEYKIYK